jgi:hypothetical protein
MRPRHKPPVRVSTRARFCCGQASSNIRRKRFVDVVSNDAPDAHRSPVLKLTADFVLPARLGQSVVLAHAGKVQIFNPDRLNEDRRSSIYAWNGSAPRTNRIRSRAAPAEQTGNIGKRKAYHVIPLASEDSSADRLDNLPPPEGAARGAQAASQHGKIRTADVRPIIAVVVAGNHAISAGRSDRTSATL